MRMNECQCISLTAHAAERAYVTSRVSIIARQDWTQPTAELFAVREVNQVRGVGRRCGTGAPRQNPDKGNRIVFDDLESEAISLLVPPGAGSVGLSAASFHSQLWTVLVLIGDEKHLQGHLDRSDAIELARLIERSGGLPVAASP